MSRKSASARARQERLEKYARSLGMAPHQVATGLERALWEAGPNPVTEFADTLEFKGKPKMPPKTKAHWDALGRFRDALTTYLVGKNAAFIGGVAVRSHGGRAGATIDYDLMIEPRLLKEITSFLEKQSATLRTTIEDTYVFYIAGCNLDFDVRVAKSALDQEALSKAKSARFLDRKLKVVRPAYLAAMKVKSYSERRDNPVKGPIDRNDIRGLVDCGATDKADIRAILKRHRPELLPTLDEILA